MARRVVEAVNSRGVKVNGEWLDFADDYSGLSYREIERGKEYELRFTKDDEGNWRIANITPLTTENRETDSNYEKRDQRIARMNALTNAVNLCVATGEADVEEVIKIAEQFYNYIMQ